jgi:hypothetical protein
MNSTLRAYMLLCSSGIYHAPQILETLLAQTQQAL